MVDIEVGEFTGRRRFDRVTAASVVLTVDAALFALLALIGVPFLLYIFADDDTGTWQHMAPLVIWWAVAAALGAACTTAVVRSFGRGGAGARRLGVVAAIATVIAVVALIVATVGRTPLLAVFGGLLAIANVAAARVLSRPGDGLAEEGLEDAFADELDFPEELDLSEEFDFRDEPGSRDELDVSDEFDLRDEVEFTDQLDVRDEVDEPALGDLGPGEHLEEPRVTGEFARTVRSAARRRLRAKAALQTHAGVRLTRRPRR